MASSSQLLILGNGFDLHCGLKSGYKDFFRNAILDTTKENFGIKNTQVGISGFWETLLLEYYIIYGSVDYNWCDIENIIKETLLRVLFIDKEMSICIWKNAYESAKLDSNPDVFASSFRNPIAKYLYKFCFQFFRRNIAKNELITDNVQLQLLVYHLLQELNDFEKRFCRYLKDQIVDLKDGEKLNEGYIVNAVNLLAKLTDFSIAEYEDLDDILDDEEQFEYEQTSPNFFSWAIKEKKYLTENFNNLKSTNILNFNYTALFDILGVKSPCVYSNVHGKLCNENCSAECLTSSVIFGIDDALIQSEYSNTELRLFSKTYRKMLNNSTPISILPPNNNTPLEIKFYGHSLSEADYSYFQSIFDFYDLYSNNKVSLIFYYSKGFEQNDEIYRLINSYGKTLMNQEQGKNLIHKLLLENRLKIVEVS